MTQYEKSLTFFINLGMQLIARHLDRANLKATIHLVNSHCAFTGQPITEGIRLMDCVSDVFTDWAYVKYPTGWVSVDVALCILDVLPGKTRNNALRNYSYYASAGHFRLLNREDILPLLLAIPEVPFRLAVTFNNKKHTSYKTVENTSREQFIVTTDLFSVAWDQQRVHEFLPIAQAWYTCIPEKAGTAAQPTWFTKAELLHGNAAYHKQAAYGVDRYEAENDVLARHRGTQLLQLVIHLLNKTQ